jgi:pyridoxamine 5'-phosphate oxidase family protein
MRPFTDAERAYLSEFRLARLATADAAGRPHVVPTSFRLDPATGIVDVGGHDVARTKKFRDVRKNAHVALVVDDLASTDPWRPSRHRDQGEGRAGHGRR